ncbi:hypothetical protein Taro_001224 [Colocasia esculenta]|uniref:Uncharacterized protein n=1 Tax=Colocasia esculenta TaxID=4460 RepID=A0A843TF95_COLES|nr:hypothetical protein [Colocasia esculenta]
MQISCKGSVDTRSSGVDTMPQTQDKIVQNWSSSVDTRSGSVDTVLQIQGKKGFKYKAKRSGSVDTRSGSVDTRDSSQNTFWPILDSVSTLAQVMSTLEAFPEHPQGCFGTVCRH